jgi:hypothetical protein
VNAQRRSGWRRRGGVGGILGTWCWLLLLLLLALILIVWFVIRKK